MARTFLQLKRNETELNHCTFDHLAQLDPKSNMDNQTDRQRNLLGQIDGIVQFVQILNCSLDVNDRLNDLSSLSDTFLFAQFLFDGLALCTQDLIDFLDDDEKFSSLCPIDRSRSLTRMSVFIAVKGFFSVVIDLSNPTKFVERLRKSAKSRLINSTMLDFNTRRNMSRSSRRRSNPTSRLYLTTNASTLKSVYERERETLNGLDLYRRFVYLGQFISIKTECR
jgi:hypothetical protein